MATTAHQAPPPQVRIYNAVYSSVQVFECMIRGIAVMRRRVDSYVNATQILKVAGIEKGRRTKILEKEILPGKHEIVQGGYGKYQGTWIPLERGREVAMLYGVAPLLAPLFDYVPPASTLGQLPSSIPSQTAPPRSPFANAFGPHGPLPSRPEPPTHPHLAPAPPIYGGSGTALQLLNQGRAQGIFTTQPSHAPSTSKQALSMHPTPAPLEASPFPHPSRESSVPAAGVKRPRPDVEMSSQAGNQGTLRRQDSQNVDMADGTRAPSRNSTISERPSQQQNGEGQPSPAKRARTGKTTALNGPLPQLPPRAQVANGGPVSPPTEDELTAKFATKPPSPRPGERIAPVRSGRRNAVLTAIHQQDDPNAVVDLLMNLTPDPAGQAVYMDAVIDDQGHTALHFAASVARTSVVEQLIANGADINRGNYMGETALIRSVLATNCYDTQAFPSIVALLHASIRTLDTARRSVLHHIAHVAAVKGRAPSARYYMECVLMWVAQHQGGDFRSLVDLQDEHGDTALNIAARIGNRSLVKTLLDVGANTVLANKLGLRPGDFGVESEDLLPPGRDDPMFNIRSAPSIPVQKSQDVLNDMAKMMEELTTDFKEEITTKEEGLVNIQTHLRAATRELAEQRRQIQKWTARCTELDLVQQRMRNLEKALREEDHFDWTGRTELDGSPAGQEVGNAFMYRGPSSTLQALGSNPVDVSFSLEIDPAIPTSDSAATLVKLKRMKMWHSRIDSLMDARLRQMQGATVEKEVQCKKIVSLCTGVPLDEVENMLESLLLAVESEAQVVDLGRVAGFMTRVKEGMA